MAAARAAPARVIGGALALLALASCQTGAEHQAAIESDLSARLERYNGTSMAEFQSRTRMLPVDAYLSAKGGSSCFRTAPLLLYIAGHERDARDNTVIAVPVARLRG